MGDEEAMPMILPKKNNTTKLRLSSSLQDLSTYNNNNNNTLSFSKTRDNPNINILNNPNNTKKKKKKWLFIVLVIVGLIAAASAGAALYLSSGTPSAFYVVLDSGSTGTRAYVYRATRVRDRNSALPFRIEDHSPRPIAAAMAVAKSPLSGRAYDRVETEPGFHKLVHNASGLKGAIVPLLKWARSQIPKRALGTTPVFLYATAGVRRLPPAHSKWLMDNAWHVLRDSPFLSRKEWVRVLSGTEEAYFGWVALNYRTKVLGALPRKPTLGALDLGGSSLQVTFETTEGGSGAGLELRIGSVRHQLTAYSLSGYGLNDAFEKSVARLVGEQGGAKEVKHPCLNRGYKESYSLGGKGVTLVGAPNWDACATLAKHAANGSGVGFPRPYGSFYAMSGFYVVYRFFNLSSDAGLDEVVEKGKEFCEKTWEDAKKSVPPQPFIEQYCFRAPYIASLLREGLRITENQITIGSGSITWTLGVALMEAASSSSAWLWGNNNSYYGGIAILALLIFVLVCAIAFWRPKLARGSSYLPLFATNNGSGGSNKISSRSVVAGEEMQVLSSMHSYSSTNLPHIQSDAFWSPHRSQMQLQSRRSQSREDLISSLP